LYLYLPGKEYSEFVQRQLCPITFKVCPLGLEG
jgi:hypothetical protein